MKRATIIAALLALAVMFDAIAAPKRSANKGGRKAAARSSTSKNSTSRNSASRGKAKAPRPRTQAPPPKASKSAAAADSSAAEANSTPLINEANCDFHYSLCMNKICTDREIGKCICYEDRQSNNKSGALDFVAIDGQRIAKGMELFGFAKNRCTEIVDKCMENRRAVTSKYENLVQRDCLKLSELYANKDKSLMGEFKALKACARDLCTATVQGQESFAFPEFGLCFDPDYARFALDIGCGGLIAKSSMPMKLQDMFFQNMSLLRAQSCERMRGHMTADGQRCEVLVSYGMNKNDIARSTKALVGDYFSCAGDNFGVDLGKNRDYEKEKRNEKILLAAQGIRTAGSIVGMVMGGSWIGGAVSAAIDIGVASADIAIDADLAKRGRISKDQMFDNTLNHGLGMMQSVAGAVAGGKGGGGKAGLIMGVSVAGAKSAKSIYDYNTGKISSADLTKSLTTNAASITTSIIGHVGNGSDASKLAVNLVKTGSTTTTVSIDAGEFKKGNITAEQFAMSTTTAGLTLGVSIGVDVANHISSKNSENADNQSDADASKPSDAGGTANADASGTENTVNAADTPATGGTDVAGAGTPPTAGGGGTDVAGSAAPAVGANTTGTSVDTSGTSGASAVPSAGGDAVVIAGAGAAVVVAATAGAVDNANIAANAVTASNTAAAAANTVSNTLASAGGDAVVVAATAGSSVAENTSVTDAGASVVSANTAVAAGTGTAADTGGTTGTATGTTAAAVPAETGGVSVTAASGGTEIADNAASVPSVDSGAGGTGASAVDASTPAAAGEGVDVASASTPTPAGGEAGGTGADSAGAAANDAAAGAASDGADSAAVTDGAAGSEGTGETPAGTGTESAGGTEGEGDDAATDDAEKNNFEKMLAATNEAGEKLDAAQRKAKALEAVAQITEFGADVAYNITEIQLEREEMEMERKGIIEHATVERDAAGVFLDGSENALQYSNVIGTVNATKSRRGSCFVNGEWFATENEIILLQWML